MAFFPCFLIGEKIFFNCHFTTVFLPHKIVTKMSEQAQKIEEKITTVDEALEENTTPITKTTETPEILTETENKGTSEQTQDMPPVEPKNDEVVNNTKLDEVKKEVVKPATTKKVVAKPPVVKKERSRFSLTGNFDAAENKIIRTVIDERKKAGLTTTDDQFVRQCVDFAINHSKVFVKELKDLSVELNNGFFGIPQNLETQPFTKKGFFNK